MLNSLLFAKGWPLVFLYYKAVPNSYKEIHTESSNEATERTSGSPDIGEHVEER